jgi:hypothetical protein
MNQTESLPANNNTPVEPQQVKIEVTVQPTVEKTPVKEIPAQEPQVKKAEKLAVQVNNPATSNDFSWELLRPEPLQKDKLNEKNAAAAQEFAEKRLQTIKALIDVAGETENDFVHREKRFIENALNYLERLNLSSQEKLAEMKAAIIEFEAEVKKNEPEKEKSQSMLAAIEKEIAVLHTKFENDQREILEVYRQKANLVAKINPAELKSIKAKNDKSKAHIIFQWILSNIYQENTSKYEYNNFKKEVFKKDNGADFHQRLNGFNFKKMKIEPVSTKKFLESKNEILEECDKEHKNESLAALFDFATLAKKIADNLDDMKHNETAIADKKNEYEKKRNESANAMNAVEGAESKLKILRKFYVSVEKMRDLSSELLEQTKVRAKAQREFVEKYGGDEPEDLEVYEAPVYDNNNNKGETGAVEGQKVEGKTTENPQTEEEGFSSGNQKPSPKKAKKEKVHAGVTDLSETPMAQKKEGGCEGCSIF